MSDRLGPAVPDPSDAAPDLLKNPVVDRTFSIEADAHSLEGMRKEGRVQGHVIQCDEGTHLGGQNQAPSPLGYLVTAIGFCLLTQLARYARMRKVSIEGARVRVTGTFRQEGSAMKGDVKAHCLEVHTALEVESSHDEAEINELVHIAENGCFVMQSLLQSVQVSGSVTVKAPLPD